MQTRLINRTAILRRLADIYVKVAQKPYKSGHDKNVYFEPTYVSDDYVFDNRPSPTTPAVELLAAEVYSKLMS